MPQNRKYLGGVKILCLVLFVSLSCRKKTPVDVLTEEEYVPIIEHCFNGIKDSNELGPDCGGDCEACNEQTPPCSPIEDIVDRDFTSFDDTIINKTVGSGGPYNYKAYFNATDYYEFSFSELPDVTTIYSTSQQFNPTSGEVRIKRYTSGGSNYYGFGELYVNYHNDGFRFFGCDIALGQIGFPIAYNITFNIPFD